MTRTFKDQPPKCQINPYNTKESESPMGIDSIKALAERADASEIIPFLEGCGKYTLAEVESQLHSLVAIQGHPSPAYRARIRIGLLNDIWDQVYGFEQASYLRQLILDRIEYRVRRKGLHGLNQELWVLASLWDVSYSEEDLDEIQEAVEDWDYLFLNEIYLNSVPSADAVVHTAGRAMYYATNGDMSGIVPVHEVLDYFGWEI